MAFYPNPFALLSHAVDALEHSVSTFPHYSTVGATSSQGARHSTTVQPSYSIQSHEDGSLVEVELPGVSKESVTLEVTNKTLTISGDRYLPKEPLFGGADKVQNGAQNTELKIDGCESAGDRAGEGNENAAEQGHEAAAERMPDSVAAPRTAEKLTYRVQFTLPPTADASNAKAEFLDGLLLLRIPRKAPVSRNITIDVK